MALSKNKKYEVVAQVGELLANSKMTVIAKYQGTPVKSMEGLRTQAINNGTKIKVIKNRLFNQALDANQTFKNVDLGKLLRGQLLYAFNDQDEVAPVQSLAKFASINPQIEFITALSADGKLLTVEEIKQLAGLPSKSQLRAQLTASIGSPVSGFITILSGNLGSFLGVLSAKAEVNAR